jgi:hypothetical protein
MFASVKKSAYLSVLCPHLFIGVHSGLASTAAIDSKCAALPARGFVVQLTGQNEGHRSKPRHKVCDVQLE